MFHRYGNQSTDFCSKSNNWSLYRCSIGLIWSKTRVQWQFPLTNCPRDNSPIKFPQGNYSTEFSLNCFWGLVYRQKAFSLISRDSHHRESLTRCIQDLNLRRTWIQDRIIVSGTFTPMKFLLGQFSPRYPTSLILNEVKMINSLVRFQKEIRKWKPLNCPCRICKVFIPNVGFIFLGFIYFYISI